MFDYCADTFTETSHFRTTIIGLAGIALDGSRLSLPGDIAP